MESRGFSLIEIVIVVALFAVLIAFGLLMSFESYRGASFRAERDTMVGVLLKARSHAMANIRQSAWGVHYDGSPQYTYTIFRGTAYDPSAPDNEAVEGNKGAALTPSPVPDVVFTQLSGTTTGTFSEHVADQGRASDVSVNYEGTIIW